MDPLHVLTTVLLMTMMSLLNNEFITISLQKPLMTQYLSSLRRSSTGPMRMIEILFDSSVLHLVESLRCQHPLPLPAMFGTRAPLGPALGGRAQRLPPTGQAYPKTYFSSLLNPIGLSHFLTDIQVCIFRLCFLQTQYAPK